MKKIMLFIVCTFLFISGDAQPEGFNIDNIFHLSFRYDAGNPFLDESSHYQPGGIGFWTDDTYSTGSFLGTSLIELHDPNQFVDLNIDQLVMSQMQGGPNFVERVRLDYDQLNFINGASWGSIDAHVYGNGGQLDLYTGVNGNYLIRLGSTNMNTLQGNLRLYGPNGFFRRYQAVSSTNFAYDWFYGENGTANLYLGVASGSTNDGRIIVYDDGGNSQAGIYINGANQGIVWGDTKLFRVKHPSKSNTEIWYASLEGPEVGAYDRGTGVLVDGEAFIEFSNHYQIIANPETMTVLLTPMEWDTYGLAVISKTDKGFMVKELKGGKGNFAFDWEVKCVRKGKEKFKVIRSVSEDLPPAPVLIAEDNGRFSEKVAGQARTDPNQRHSHSKDCVHSKK